MCADWQQGFDPNVLAQKIEGMKEVDAETGEVSFEGFGLRRVVTVLHSSVRFSEEMPEGHERGIVHKAVRSVARAGKITSGRLLQAINEGEDAFRRMPRKPFVLVTSLSVRHFEELWKCQADESAVTFDRYLPEPFRSEHERARATAEEQVIGQLPKQHGIMRAYAPTRVSVQARSHQEALETSLEILDLLRGVWNLALNRTVEIRSSFGIRKPVNRLVLGPVHSLHSPDGYLVDQSPWIEDGYVRALVAYNLKPEWTYVQEYEHFVWQELLKVPYRRDLEASIRRYARALDRRDWNSSFVRLWGLLETLTATHNHKKVTARVLPLMKDEHKDFHRQILKHLNRHRNRTVHAGHETVAAEILLYQLKFYAEKLLEFHLSASPAFDSVNEANLFLDSATEADVSRRLSGQ